MFPLSVLNKSGEASNFITLFGMMEECIQSFKCREPADITYFGWLLGRLHKNSRVDSTKPLGPGADPGVVLVTCGSSETFLRE